MPNLAVNIAVMQDGKILLTQRDDFETWILPGGGVEDGESVAQAAIREAKEESGLDVELTRLVGIYSRLGNVSPGYIVLFAARPIGGERKCQEGETIAVEWFAFDGLPSPLSAGHQRRIRDVLEGANGIVVRQEIRSPLLPEKISRKELYEMRDLSGVERQAFYVHMFENADIHEVTELE